MVNKRHRFGFYLFVHKRSMSEFMNLETPPMINFISQSYCIIELPISVLLRLGSRQVLIKVIEIDKISCTDYHRRIFTMQTLK